MGFNQILLLLTVTLSGVAPVYAAPDGSGKRLYSERCAMCHGADAKGSGPLANKSTPPTPDLTTPAFRQRLAYYPGVIVSSIILRPNGDLIPQTLRQNGYRVPSHAWTVQDFRDINDYIRGLIAKPASDPRPPG